MPWMRKLLGAEQGRFSLLALFEFVTLCSLLAAFAPLVGGAASGALILFALALFARQGGLALALLMVVFWCVDEEFAGATVWSQLTALTIAAGLCAWFAYRRRELQSSMSPNEP